MTMTEAVKQMMLGWDPTAFDQKGSGVIRGNVLSSGRVIYRYVPYDIRPGERVGVPMLISVNPDDLSDVRFSNREEFYEFMGSSSADSGILE